MQDHAESLLTSLCLKPACEIRKGSRLQGEVQAVCWEDSVLLPSSSELPGPGESLPEQAEEGKLLRVCQTTWLQALNLRLRVG